MASQIWVNSSRLERGRAVRKVDGMDITIEVSPYSVPRAVTGRHDKNLGLFVITFQYVDKEPMGPARDFQGVTIREGRFSRKILSLAFGIDRPPFDRVSAIRIKTEIAKAFEERTKGLVDPGPNDPDVLNQQIAEEILTESNLKTLVATP